MTTPLVNPPISGFAIILGAIGGSCALIGVLALYGAIALHYWGASIGGLYGSIPVGTTLLLLSLASFWGSARASRRKIMAFSEQHNQKGSTEQPEKFCFHCGGAIIPSNDARSKGKRPE